VTETPETLRGILTRTHRRFVSSGAWLFGDKEITELYAHAAAWAADKARLGDWRRLAAEAVAYMPVEWVRRYHELVPEEGSMAETPPPGTMTAAMKDPTPDLTSESLRAALFGPTNDYCRFCGNLRCEGHVDDCEGLAHADAMGRLETMLAHIEKEGHKRGCPLCGTITRTNGDYVRHHNDDCALRRFDKNERPAAQGGEHG